MRRLFPVLVAFVLLGFAYSLAIPIFEAPDELQHFATLNYIARYQWFPPLGQPGEHLWDQEALQAPLYYLLGAAATAWVDTSDFSRQAVLQPKPNIGDATLPGKKNAFLHGPAQAFPYRGTTLAVHLARWLSVLLGAGTVALTFVAAAHAFAPPRKPGEAVSLLPPPTPRAVWLATLSAAWLAFIPQFIFIHASANNDTAMTFTATLTLVALLWLARNGVTLRRAAWLGAAIGLMILSKLTGTALAVVALGLLLILARRAPPAAVAALAALAAGGWWYARNQWVYGDPLALGAFLRFVGGNTGIKAVSPTALIGQFRLLRFSTWGLFGHISLLMQPTAIYSVYDALAAVGVAGAAVGLLAALALALRRGGAVQGMRQFAAKYSALAICAVWLAAVLAVAARWFFAAGIQGRLIFPGLPALGILIVYGLDVWLTRLGGARLPERVYPALTLGVGVPMLGMAIAVVPLYLAPAYLPPPLVARVPAGVVPVAITFADEIALRGYTIARDGDMLRLTFYWDTLRAPSADYTVAIRLVRGDGSFWLDYVNYPGMGTTLPTTWRPGELRRDEYVFDLKRFDPAPAPLRLIVGYFDPRTRAMTPVSGWSDMREAGWATLTEWEMGNGK